MITIIRATSKKLQIEWKSDGGHTVRPLSFYALVRCSSLTVPHYPRGKRGRPPIEMGINFFEQDVPNDATLLHFRHLLEDKGIGKLFFTPSTAYACQGGRLLIPHLGFLRPFGGMEYGKREIYPRVCSFILLLPLLLTAYWNSSCFILCFLQSTPPPGGRPADAVAALPPIEISIHAPRPGGDRRGLGNVDCEDISIHAPRPGGDRGHSGPLGGARISIHAPRPGGDGIHAIALLGDKDFNPRPPPGGRLWYKLTKNGNGLFQSTPPARGAT